MFLMGRGVNGRLYLIQPVFTPILTKNISIVLSLSKTSTVTHSPIVSRNYKLWKHIKSNAAFMFFLYAKKIKLLVCFLCLLGMHQLTAQSEYKIRLTKDNSASDGEACYQVALNSTQAPWYLAGQNYRLFYDASTLSFQSGTSLLSDSYQKFNLVQNEENIDASGLEDCLHYANTLGFLNYSIDLLNTTSESASVPNNNDWLPTTRLCFKQIEGQDKAPTITWARPELTSVYARSYIEISEYLDVNKAGGAKGAEYIDIGNPCQPTSEENNGEEEEEEEEEVELGGGGSQEGIQGEILPNKKYNIRIVPSDKETETSICYTVSLQSASPDAWRLGGQNYRIYFDASQLSFQEGSSFLLENYEDLKLIENIDLIDASGATGCLPFATNLGFLNYSIELQNSSLEGELLPIEEEWLPTSELCFSKKETFQEAGFVWARDTLTAGYATSFVEITEWVEPEKTVNAIPNDFVDIGTACEQPQVAESVWIEMRAFLQGPYNSDLGWMEDGLRENNQIPLNDPYASSVLTENKDYSPSGEIEASLLTVEGKDAVVDWVLIELRDKEDATKILSMQSALILRNGQIVSIDGKSKIEIAATPQAYFIGLRHRNHLGIMTAAPIELTADQQTNVLIDFTDPRTEAFGNNARKKMGDSMCLWAGNADANAFLILEGSGIALPDRDKIFFDVLLNENNADYNYNYILRGYYDSDVNMDGEIRYQGINNERDVIFFNVINHPQNPNFYTNFFIEEQLPE